jgi:class 3 adenylate cyclase
MMIRNLLSSFQGREIATVGDGFLALCDGPARAIRCARAAVDGGRDGHGAVRGAAHRECGPMGDDVGGIAAHIGARVADQAGPGRCSCCGPYATSSPGSDIAFEDRGDHRFKGVPRGWQLLAVLRSQPKAEEGSSDAQGRQG